MAFSVEDVKEWIRSWIISKGQTLEESVAYWKGKVDPGLVDQAAAEIRESIGYIEDLKHPVTISRRRFEPWYEGPLENHRFWPPYRNFLVDEKGWDKEKVVDVLDKSSSKVVFQLPNPALKKFSGRGLVLGYVQSGKTANFIAVTAKAADAGYRLIVVLSGLTNVLRQQTQERFESDLLSHDTDNWVTWTDADRDIGDTTIKPTALLNNPAQRHIAIIKKNKHRLERLIDMLREMGDAKLKNCPILIIDDECDQASVNSARLQAERTAINRLLVELLELVPKVAYVGYTATPYANVLIDPKQPKDIYPRDFIIDLPRPDEYFGAERLFGRDLIATDAHDEEVDDGLDMIRTILDDEEPELRPASRHEKDTWKLPITDSVAEALRYFAMAATARELRHGEPVAISMLIHTTFYEQSMRNSMPVVEKYLDDIGQRVAGGDSGLIAELSTQWETECNAVPSEDFGHERIPAEAIIEHLPEVLSRTKVFVESGKSLNRIKPYKGPFVAIGGNILARGLTLDGLTCSLFVRTTSMYDSLMQMGRWFGYRRGYEDLPRVWMPEEMQNNFKDLATVEHEIRRDIEIYSEDGEISPLDVGVRIRLHPRLEVTSKLKQRHAVVDGIFPYSGRVLQTIRFATEDASWLKQNLDAGDILLNQCAEVTGGSFEGKSLGDLYSDVDWSVVREFLETYQIHPTHADFNAQRLMEYVEYQQDYGHLTKWNIGLIRSGAAGAEEYPLIGPHTNIPMVNRSALYDIDGGKNIGVLLGMRHATIDFPDSYTGPKDSWKYITPARSTVANPATEVAVRNPLLLMYLIDRNSVPKGKTAKGDRVRHDLEAATDVLGIGLILPVSSNLPTVQYVVADLPVVEQDDADEFADEDFEMDD